MRRRQIQGRPTPYHFEGGARKWHDASIYAPAWSADLTAVDYFPTVITGDSYAEAMPPSWSADLTAVDYFPTIITGDSYAEAMPPAWTADLTTVDYFPAVVVGDSYSEQTLTNTVQPFVVYEKTA